MLGVFGSPEGPGDDPLRTQLLSGMHRGLLEREQAEEPVQLPPVPPGVQPQTAAEQKHGARRSRGEVSPVWASGKAATGVQSQRGEVHRMFGEESHGRPLLPDVRAVVLRGSPEGARRECPREGPQAGSTRASAGREAVSAAPQAAEAVLPHRPAVRLLPVRQGATQEPRRGVRGGGESGAAGLL